MPDDPEQLQWDIAELEKQAEVAPGEAKLQLRSQIESLKSRLAAVTLAETAHDDADESKAEPPSTL